MTDWCIAINLAENAGEMILDNPNFEYSSGVSTALFRSKMDAKFFAREVRPIQDWRIQLAPPGMKGVYHYIPPFIYVDRLSPKKSLEAQVILRLYPEITNWRKLHEILGRPRLNWSY